MRCRAQVPSGRVAAPFGTQRSPVNPPTRPLMPCPGKCGGDSARENSAKRAVLNRVPIWSLRTRTRQHCTDLRSENTQVSGLEGTSGTSGLSL
jgi:hypothetical protein